ncbi:NusG antitermination factor [Desulfofarcimen acetoxidans DSM 771]|uniref:Transcription termination/antitermination protein NusG n=1 Tax=Desulfofarcimen acetoxidans (strain ATCC 49208 / DSM 771 / KCTC 5769 / VKM B-1644 / 5575) TaxID=485916 RepID=C8VZE8_DESAS|nr:antiterminator LoaP [Desulfofarcimen acetoxidans]ACV64893.1 NusG antitermination factor [Desulfofarcimen acetoxidans DSM 771]
MHWYVIHCLTGHEEDVRSRVKEKDIARAVVPRRLMVERRQGGWQYVERVVFPGYVFVQAHMTPAAYYAMRNLPGVIRVLGTSRPVPLMGNEVTLFLKLCRDGDPLGLSEVFVKGGSVKVISGPLMGLEGHIVKLDARRFRAKVNISLMGEPRIVELAVSVIKKT